MLRQTTFGARPIRSLDLNHVNNDVSTRSSGSRVQSKVKGVLGTYVMVRVKWRLWLVIVQVHLSPQYILVSLSFFIPQSLLVFLRVRNTLSSYAITFPYVSFIMLACCTSFPAWCICLANRPISFLLPSSLLSNPSYTSPYALLLDFAIPFSPSRRYS